MCVHVGVNMLYVMRPTDEHNMCTACRGTTGNALRLRRLVCGGIYEWAIPTCRATGFTIHEACSSVVAKVEYTG